MHTYTWLAGRIDARWGEPEHWDASTVLEVQESWAHLASASRQQRAAVLRGILSTARRSDLLSEVVSPTRRAGLPRPAPESAVADVWAMPDCPGRRAALLAAYVGLRAAECAGLRWVDATDVVVVRRGKGGRSRGVAVPPALRADMTAWARQGPHVVYSARGAGYLAGSLGIRANNQLRAHDVGWTLHTFRHRYGTQLYRATRDLLLVQRMMGHSSPATTAGYVQLADDDAVRAVALLPVPGGVGGLRLVGGVP